MSRTRTQVRCVWRYILDILMTYIRCLGMEQMRTSSPTDVPGQRHYILRRVAVTPMPFDGYLNMVRGWMFGTVKAGHRYILHRTTETSMPYDCCWTSMRMWQVRITRI